MPHKIEALFDYLTTRFDTEPKTNLHIGEAMGFWLYYTALAEEIPVLEAALNTTTDNVLIGLLKEAKKLGTSQMNIIEDFLIKEGVSLSDTSQHKPKSDPNSIPLGVKSTDSEIVNLVSAKVAANIILCSNNIAQSIRSDVGLIWIRFHSEKAIFGMDVKTKMREHGWIKVPPYYYPPGSPNN
ncbi:hypothetical protein GCM10011351_06500 [Paraliobacillus quinghaiensis]|uniref:DUF3231 family protein n=1 Tax=Paraliobacillus quinghaiensis TaxID=470815 RepID=A0A917THI7_9BACI|nr:DUF3231 family protein [Paraliobacillus quinghaiensis]GGM23418.1 hypothetical protein GCM10011351_06500 [Paraliobacillus quinghaiensis]